MSKENKNNNALTPEDFTGMELDKPSETAAGIPAVISAVKHVYGAMNPIRATKVLLDLNQEDGTDCPGCAWPDPETRSKLGEYCENGAKAIAEEATTKIVDPAFFERHSVNDMAAQSDYWIGKRGRLTDPMILEKEATHYKKISWDAAFDLIGKELKALASPDDAIFYTSGRTSNEAAFLYQLFVRMYGTNNLPDCSNMCHESSGVALSKTLGIGKGSVKLEDFYQAEVIMVIGQNPGTNHPRMLSALKKAKIKGAKIITINPLPETGLIKFKNPQELDNLVNATKLTDLFLQVKINGDVALLKGIMKCLYDKEQQAPGTVFDHEFIEKHTSGYDDLINDIKQVDTAKMAEISGVPLAQIEETAALLADKKKIIICWAMGITQHVNGVQNIQEIVNLLLLKGSIGKPGAGTCPVRGHSNVQGDRTMGIWEKPKDAFLDKLEETFSFKAPRAHGLDVVHAIKTMHEKKDLVFIAMGGNFLSAAPDTEYTATALEHCKLTVHISTKLNRSHLVTGEQALILPCLGRSDKDIQNGQQQFISVENSMGVVHSSTGKLKPVSENLLSEPVIVAKMAKASLKNNTVDWDAMVSNYDAIRDKIEAVIPGFENYNERVRKPAGFYLPNGARVGEFHTLNGKANFTVNPVPDNTLDADEFLMMTIRTHDQFNTTIYGLDDRYRGIFNERRVVMMNKTDMKEAGLHKGDVVDLYNYHGDVERCAPHFIVIPYDIPRSCTATYFPETNVLVPIDSKAEFSHTPSSKFIKIKIVKHN